MSGDDNGLYLRAGQVDPFADLPTKSRDSGRMTLSIFVGLFEERDEHAQGL